MKHKKSNIIKYTMSKTKYGLEKYYQEDDIFEIGVDEAGRGPLFGRVYTAGVILPKDNSFEHELMRDSKKITSKVKIKEVAEYIKQNAISWSVSYETEQTIDKINIRQSVLKSMHNSIKTVLDNVDFPSARLLIDGNDFKPYIHFRSGELEQCPHITIEGGDNKYTPIAAASILAKVARDEYIENLVATNPDLETKYGIGGNKGYGAKRHLDGIKEHGITNWHRKTYGICKQYV